MSDWKDKWVRKPHPVIVALVAIASLAMLWSGATGRTDTQDPQTGGVLTDAVVIRVLSTRDIPQSLGGRTTQSQTLLVRLDDGREVQVHNDLTPLEPGDALYLNTITSGADDETFEILDFKRSRGLLWLAIVFAAAVLAVSGLRKGLFALVGTLCAIAVIFAYILPSIVQGGEPVTVALTGAIVILVGTFYVSYGFNRKSLAALVGIAVTLVLVAVLAQWAVGELRFTGYGDESSIYLNSQTGGSISLVALIVAGIIIAALGVLDDVAITQSSAVYELAHAGSRGWHLFYQAMRIGTDHISAVINTLVLAYAGAALPLVLLLHLTDYPLAFLVGGEQIGEEVARTLLSSLGLVLAVPLTTAIAVAFVYRWGVGTNRD